MIAYMIAGDWQKQIKSQNFSPTVIVEYEIMKIIRDTYNDATMDNIYMVKFEETKDQQGTLFFPVT